MDPNANQEHFMTDAMIGVIARCAASIEIVQAAEETVSN
jgi:hypothetical protein